MIITFVIVINDKISYLKEYNTVGTETFLLSKNYYIILVLIF